MLNDVVCGSLSKPKIDKQKMCVTRPYLETSIVF